MRKVRYFIKETIERPVTKKEFLLRQKEEVVGDCVSKGELIRGKTFTEPQIKELVGLGVLSPRRYHSKIFFSLRDVQNGIKKVSDFKKRGQIKLELVP